jgi:hypothetical protein
MRFATSLAAVSALSFAAILLVPPSSPGQTAQTCPQNPKTCNELSACAPFKDKNDPNYVKWINCVAYGNPDGPSHKPQNTDRGGLPFQSPLIAPSR